MIKKIISLSLRTIPRKYLQLISHFIIQNTVIFYKGNNVNCPICEKSFRKFLPYGRIPRNNALCPSCLALERHRVLWLYLKKSTNFFTEKLKMLHIAPEICFIARFKKMPNLDYITGDIESPLADIEMDIHNIPFNDDTFDVIFCNHVLEHVKNDILAMEEIKRVLKPGGWAILQIPLFYPLSETTYEDDSIINPKDREREFGQDDHVRMYGKDFSQRIQRAGLKSEQINWVEDQGQNFVERHALPLNEIIFRATKQ